MKEYIADLHIHTCLSPCADLLMTPSSIVTTSLKKGINIIAITDHNSAENISAAITSAEGTGLTVLPGMEITTAEEAHMLALFNDLQSALQLQTAIYDSMLPGKNDEKFFGEQIVVNEKDEVLAFNDRLLISANNMAAQEIIETVHSLGGIAVASHVDKEAFSIISQLGFIPEDMPFDALELSRHTSREQADERFGMYRHFGWIASSDAHSIEDIGRRTCRFLLKEATVGEISMAVRGIDGRSVQWE